MNRDDAIRKQYVNIIADEYILHILSHKSIDISFRAPRSEAFRKALASKWASKVLLRRMRVAVWASSSSDLSKFCSSVTYLITDNRSIDLGALSSSALAANEGD